ncbi:hypothetical protein Tco_0511661 [Tanacetum coccineum]
MSKRARSTRCQSSSTQGVLIEEKVRMLKVFKSGVHQICHDALARRRIHFGEIINWDFLASQGLAQAFFESINKDPFSGPQWVNLFQTNENVYRELVREFFASFEFDASPCRYDPNHLGVRFRLGGEKKEISLLELGFNVGNAKVAAIRDPRVKLAHRCIATTIAGRKESTHRITEINLFYLYCIYSDEVVCNIPYWLAKYMIGMREKSLICGGMGCFWPAAREAIEEDKEDDESDEEAGGGAGHEGAGGPADMYRNMSQGDWQVRQACWMDQQDEQWVRINT